MLVSGSVVLPMEFKVGCAAYERADADQAWDYGLDLFYDRTAEYLDELGIPSLD